MSQNKQMSRVDLRDRAEALRDQTAKMFHLIPANDIQLWRRLKDAEFALYCARVLLAAPLPGEFDVPPSSIFTESEVEADAVDSRGAEPVTPHA